MTGGGGEGTLLLARDDHYISSGVAMWLPGIFWASQVRVIMTFQGAFRLKGPLHFRGAVYFG